MKTVQAGAATIPALGFGTWKLRGQEATDMVARALAEGWRHVDTARMYGNEAEVGAGIRAASAPRADVFLTTKIWPDDHAPDRLRAAAEDSLKNLGVDHVDLMLLHWPSKTAPLEETIPALTKLVADGLAANVGVSNFPRWQLREAAKLADVPLATNQVEFHPFFDQSAMLEALAELGMALTAYIPLARGKAATDETLARIGEAHGVSAAGAALAWILSKGAIAIPKTANPARLAENAAALDVTLSAEEIAAIDAMATGPRLVSDPSRPELMPDWD